jgi:hypothetical protein
MYGATHIKIINIIFTLKETNSSHSDICRLEEVRVGCGGGFG